MDELDSPPRKHESFRQNSFNLVASENVMSENARKNPKCIKQPR